MKPWERYTRPSAASGGKPWERYALPPAPPVEVDSTPDAEPDPLSALVAAMRNDTGEEMSREDFQARIEKMATPGFRPGVKKGLGHSAIQTYLGLKDLAGAGEPQDQAVRDIMDAEAAEIGTDATIGRVGGTIAQMALPGSVLLKGGKVLNKAVQATRAMPQAVKAATRLATGPVAAGAGSAALHEAAQTPDEGETRLGAGAKAGATAAVAGAVIGKVIAGVQKTPQALRILREGGYLTPGMAGKSRTWPALESVLQVTPILGRGAKNARKLAEASWNKLILNKAVPPGGGEVTAGGQRGFAQLKRMFGRAYTNAWAKAPAWVNPSDALAIGRQGIRTVGKKQGRILSNLIDEIKTIQRPQSVDNVIRTAQQSRAARKDVNFLEVLTKMRQGYRAAAGKDAQTALAAVDKTYPSYLAVRRAAKSAKDTGGVFTPKQLNTAGSVVGGETRAAAGQGALMKEALEGVETVGRSQSGMPLAFFRRLADISPTPLPMQTIGQTLIGRTPVQLTAADIATQLRRIGVTPGATYEATEKE